MYPLHVSSTRDRILDAAREILEKEGEVAPTMSAIARAAGLSRQAVYLHFPDRTALLVALVEHVDRREDLAAGLETMRAAPDAAAEIRAWVDMQSWRNPRIAPLARALDHARHRDPASSEAWRDRTSNRMRGAVEIVRRLRRERILHPTWKSAEAAALLWEMTSFRVWDDLVNDAGMAPERYVEVVTSASLAALAAPVGRRKR